MPDKAASLLYTLNISSSGGISEMQLCDMSSQTFFAQVCV